MLYYRTYVIDPSTPWVTFIHGAGGSSSIWYKQLKEFKNHFNVLLVDLRGHGKSGKGDWKKGDSFDQVSEEVVKVLNHLHIKTTHFVGISLGTIVIQTIARKHPDRISSMILGGAVIKLNLRTNFLLTVGKIGRYFIPYMWLYRLFAWIIMPQQSQVESRNVFISSAKKMCQKEFIRWFQLTRRINPYLKNLQFDFKNIPTLFIMGQEDYLFLPPVKMLVEKNQSLKLVNIEDCGHVCNIDQPQRFNEETIAFIKQSNKSEFQKAVNG
ncbi:alpha/beta hydrolase [Bacillus sp. 31A1R]|uniref:Alpha/beta hydrolase n=1 Tax=Robertmurraya mangrovi TaxID=3098077 RepID=A0ABU5J363_9BACI|nr:alpha/beta hydrolase [Bacillus sp. 31A1R]MDZ5473844.1 alpha/beta hydrolase [Bacillus sp. 31A1R]